MKKNHTILIRRLGFDIFISTLLTISFVLLAVLLQIESNSATAVVHSPSDRPPPNYLNSEIGTPPLNATAVWKPTQIAGLPKSVSINIGTEMVQYAFSWGDRSIPHEYSTYLEPEYQLIFVHPTSPAFDSFLEKYSDQNFPKQISVTRRSYGLPFYAMYWDGEFWNYSHGYFDSVTYQNELESARLHFNQKMKRFAGLNTGIQRPQTFQLNGTSYRIPISIYWTGFLFNTLFFAGLIEAFRFGRKFLRTYIWRHSGRCISCGYAIDGLEVCPECGRIFGDDDVLTDA
tara:strand:- start:1606 stop:2466 length:861 start_codon:yes stop_codon:yes gene_type:complete